MIPPKLRDYVLRLQRDASHALEKLPPAVPLAECRFPLSAAAKSLDEWRRLAWSSFLLSGDVAVFDHFNALAGEQLLNLTQQQLAGENENARRGTVWWDDAWMLSLMFDDDACREVIHLLQPLDAKEDRKQSHPWSIACFNALTAMILESSDAHVAASEFVGVCKAIHKTWVGHAEAVRAVALRDWDALVPALGTLCKSHRSICATGAYRNQPIHTLMSILGVATVRFATRRGFSYVDVHPLIPAEAVGV